MSTVAVRRAQPALPAELIEHTVDALDRASLSGADLVNLLCASRLLFDAAHRKLYQDLIVTQRNAESLLAQMESDRAGPSSVASPFRRTRQIIFKSLSSDLPAAESTLDAGDSALLPSLRKITLHPEALIALAEYQSVRQGDHPMIQVLRRQASTRHLEEVEVHLPPHLRRVGRGPTFCCGPSMGHWIYTGTALPCPGCRRERIGDADLLGPVAALIGGSKVARIRILGATLHKLDLFDGPGKRDMHVVFRPCRCQADPEFWDECDNHVSVSKRLDLIETAVKGGASDEQGPRNWTFEGTEHIEELKGEKEAMMAEIKEGLLHRLVVTALLGRVATLSFFNPFRRAQSQNASGAISIQVKWGREKFNIPIPNASVTPLSQLLATLSSQTGIPLPQLKLIYKGAVLKDQSLTLGSYGIGDGAVLVLVGKEGEVPNAPPTFGGSGAAAGQQAASKKKRQPETDQEPVLVEYIQGLVRGLLDPLRPAIITFVSQTDPKATNRPAQIPSFEVLQREHARLSELLLRGLLDLDGVEVPGGWAEARKERKEAVKTVQAQLTRVDEAWGERKKLGQK